MERADEKMLMIGNSISKQVEQERRAIIDKANDIRDSAIEEYKDQVIKAMFEELQQKTRTVRQKAVRDKALAESGARRELLTRREELAATVFARARARLNEYAATDGYRETLLADLGAALREYPQLAGGSDTIVMLREADMPLADKIKKLLPSCEVKPERSVKIGGFRLRNRETGILLDETLDSRLEGQRPWFLESCGLKVTDN